jgi:hypothetical protein
VRGEALPLATPDRLALKRKLTESVSNENLSSAPDDGEVRRYSVLYRRGKPATELSGN